MHDYCYKTSDRINNKPNNIFISLFIRHKFQNKCSPLFRWKQQQQVKKKLRTNWVFMVGHKIQSIDAGREREYPLYWYHKLGDITHTSHGMLLCLLLVSIGHFIGKLFAFSPIKSSFQHSAHSSLLHGQYFYLLLLDLKIIAEVEILHNLHFEICFSFCC